jgi:uncharacterized circularly permuted ATP-grasp superfamily protein
MRTLETTSFDEAYDSGGAARAHYAALLSALDGADLAALQEAAQRHADELGASFGDDRFRIDPVPRLFEAAAWDRLAAGLQQRVRALNAYVADVYGERRIVAAGVMPERVIDEADGYEPELQGRLPTAAAPIAIAGLDIVCDEQGTLRVLEDNCRTPSGYCYALAARRAVTATLDHGGTPPPRELAGPLRELLTGALRAAAPPGVEDPVVVVLSDGRSTGTGWEHEQVAMWIGAELVTPGDQRLRVRNGRLLCGTQPVDVVYRRTDIDGLRGDDGAPTDVARLLAEPWLGGRLGLVNGFGTGVADDKLAHAYVEGMIAFYLGEEPLLESVRTLDLGRSEHVEEILDDLRAHVVKPRGGAGGEGVVICAHADEDTLADVRERLQREPGRYVAQRTVALSRHPTISDEGRMEPRHVDLRPFIFSGDGWTRALPGGLTRVALDRGTLVVNSSQHGGGKDTWVLEAA